MYPDCLDCKHSYIDDIYHEVHCRFNRHFCEEIDEFLYEGRMLNKNGTIIECKSFKGKIYEE